MGMFQGLALFLSVAAATLTPQHAHPIYPRQAAVANATEPIFLLACGRMFIKLLAYDGKQLSLTQNVSYNGNAIGLLVNQEKSLLHVANDDGLLTKTYQLVAGVRIGDIIGTSGNNGSLTNLNWGFQKDGPEDTILGTSRDPAAIAVYGPATNHSGLTLRKHIAFFDPTTRPGVAYNDLRPSQIILEPRGRRFYVVPLSHADVLLIVDASTNRIINRHWVPPRCTPRRGVFWAPLGLSTEEEKTYLLISCDDSRQILLYEVVAGRISLTMNLVQSLSTYDPDFPADLGYGTKPGDLLIQQRDGQVAVADVYVSHQFNPNHTDTISHIELTYEDNYAGLQFKGSRPSGGIGPVSMTIDDTGRTLFIANQHFDGVMSNGLVAWDRDPTTGELGLNAAASLPWLDIGNRSYNSSGPVFVMQWMPNKPTRRIKASY